MIVTALSSNLVEPRDVRNVTAMVFTDGIHPHHKIMDLIKASGVPVMLVNQDSFSVATKINKSIFKLRAEESDKIKQSQDLIEEYVDVDGICELL
ncbi:MAG: hypothetical protein GWN00_26420 [Aliifodinibius sp.]|nr:hypothetical protein [candidate division Zixibacteria bacterium]NIT59625.1 hypothetical protein [Fodinibius sp.]NIS49194.1 hypothetical protein [candidate division Zixibacteria bacterium]NIU17301.1 hypothetical protein [candidate division Zixibacteria bacterium]NIV09421.1 hypothetical protein [candidate division Zixibacteria bacterium]